MTNKSSIKTLKKQATGFAITGTLSTLIMFGIYVFLNKFINYQYAYFISYSISVVALYFMNSLFVFKSRHSLQTIVKFPLIYLLQYIVGAFSLKFIVRMGISETFAPILVVILLLPITFLLNRVVLMKKKSH